MAIRKTPHIGLVLSPPRFRGHVWTLVSSCLQLEAERRGVLLTHNPVHGESEQAAELQRLLEQGVDAIVMKPMSMDNPAIVDCLNKAAVAGVPIITLDTRASKTVPTHTVGSDNASGLVLTSEYIFECMGYC